ncbi:MAG: chromosomal replication initiator protein DnaA [Spirochaetaceae bacterium]|jgi:chromosomal replication initiator protein|nr:chromosomal replication initiator protein DnaA [Spirochaetaceae bacterium]
MTNWDYSVFWQEMLNQIGEELGEAVFNRWFKQMKYQQSGENTITVVVPSAFYRDQIISRYQKLIETKLFGIAGRHLTLVFEIIPHKNENTEAAAPLSSIQPVSARALPPRREKHPQLREDFIFERYIIGDNNHFAANAALAISRNPGTTYNPFFVYGGVGLGKTHLMQAIGNYIHSYSKNKVIYISSENFTNEFVESIREGKMAAFKHKYRFIDVLLIDDIQFLENKWETQGELFHTFNALRDANKQLVFTCDKPASALKHIEERLRSRFENGLNVDMQSPNYETRCAILRSKLAIRHVSIPDEVIITIARNISTNVRDLEAALNKLIAYTELMGKPITVDKAGQQLKDIFHSPKPAAPAHQLSFFNVSLDTIQEVVAHYYHVSTGDLSSRKRSQQVVKPRQIAMYISRKATGFSNTEIGQAFGGREYTTVMHAYRKVGERLQCETELNAAVHDIIEKLKVYG